MKTQHTPGPWHANGVYIEDQHGTIAKVMRPEDNAALIASAPELLGALENLLSYAEDAASDRDERPDCIIEARAAIQKVRGE